MESVSWLLWLPLLLQYQCAVTYTSVLRSSAPRTSGRPRPCTGVAVWLSLCFPMPVRSSKMRFKAVARACELSVSGEISAHRSYILSYDYPYLSVSTPVRIIYASESFAFCSLNFTIMPQIFLVQSNSRFFGFGQFDQIRCVYTKIEFCAEDTMYRCSLSCDISH